MTPDTWSIIPESLDALAVSPTPRRVAVSAVVLFAAVVGALLLRGQEDPPRRRRRRGGLGDSGFYHEQPDYWDQNACWRREYDRARRARAPKIGARAAADDACTR